MSSLGAVRREHSARRARALRAQVVRRAIDFASVTNDPAGGAPLADDDRFVATVLAYLAPAAVAGWGVAHAIPTGKVVIGFEPVSVDNRRVIVQEWLAEAFTMWGVAAIVIVATAVGGASGNVTVWVYRVVAGLLMALAGLTGLTGARTPVVWFKICPVLLTGSAVLLLVASWLSAGT